MRAETERHAGAKERLAEDVREYLALSLYLWICIGAVFLYRAALLEDRGLGHLELRVAAVKALVLAKFAMLGRMASIGATPDDVDLFPAVLRASFGVLVVLVGLMAVEEALVDGVRLRGLEGALAEIAAGRWAEVATGVILLWLILLSYLAYRRLRTGTG